jgi:hypothetical protein
MGVVGCRRGTPARVPTVYARVSGRFLERAAVEGESPVHESLRVDGGWFSRVAASSWNLL